jgi:hypothetical protein
MPRVVKLTDEQRLFVVQALACFDTPARVRELLKAEFPEAEISVQGIESYNPTKRQGKNLGQKWRTIFEETRKTFISDTSAIPISHRNYRLMVLNRMAQDAEKEKNKVLAAQLMKQAAEEMGNAYTNKRELTGAGGGSLVVTIAGKDADL